MTTYHVTANNIDFGYIDANTPKDARDFAARMAGYADEDSMEVQLEQPSAIVAKAINPEQQHENVDDKKSTTIS